MNSFTTFFVKDKYGKRRIVKENVSEYVKTVYGADDAKCLIERTIPGLQPLLQEDFGVDNCCSLASVSSALVYDGAGKEPRAVFDTVYGNAKKLFFGRRGTNPFMIKPIFDMTLKKLGKKPGTGAAFVKNVGVRFGKIMALIDSGTPVVFSLLTDGRGFYKDHTMLIAGYAVYYAGGKEHRFLLLHDNWMKTVSYLDFDRLPFICSMNWCKKGGMKQ